MEDRHLCGPGQRSKLFGDIQRECNGQLDGIFWVERKCDWLRKCYKLWPIFHSIKHHLLAGVPRLLRHR